MQRLRSIFPFAFGELSHPYKTVLLVALFASGITFFALACLFLFYRIEASEEQNHLSPYFVASTSFIVLASRVTRGLTKTLDQGHLSKLSWRLGFTTIAMVVFGFLQYLGWQDFSAEDMAFSGHPSSSLLYVISGFHLLHLLGLFLYNIHLWRECGIHERDHVKMLVYTTEPYVKVKYQIFEFFWNFLEILWIVLFTLFALVLL